MRRRAALVLAGLALLLAGCGGGKTTLPLPETVEGPLPKAAPLPNGDPAAGKKLFAAQGCNACHTFTPAGSKAIIGPSLDNLAADATRANQGPLRDYTASSIKNPSAYLTPGFKGGIMPSFAALSNQQIADLVAFLTQKS